MKLLCLAAVKYSGVAPVRLADPSAPILDCLVHYIVERLGP